LFHLAENICEAEEQSYHGARIGKICAEAARETIEAEDFASEPCDWEI
jgi:hypothetical protein